MELWAWRGHDLRLQGMACSSISSALDNGFKRCNSWWGVSSAHSEMESVPLGFSSILRVPDKKQLLAGGRTKVHCAAPHCFPSDRVKSSSKSPLIIMESHAHHLQGIWNEVELKFSPEQSVRRSQWLLSVHPFVRYQIRCALSLLSGITLSSSD